VHHQGPLERPFLPAACERRRLPEDTTRAVDHSVVETICTRRDIDLRERLLWRMLFETASRATAVLDLNVEDLDLDNRRARIRVKGGDTGWITWGRGTAMLLPRYLRGRQAGPLFCSERRPGQARAQPTLWLIEGLIAYLDAAAVHRLLDQVTELCAPGSELLCDAIGQSFLECPWMRPWLEHLAARGTPWRFGTDQPEDLFVPRGWQPTAALFSTAGTRLGRWPFPAYARDTPGIPQSYLVHATR